MYLIIRNFIIIISVIFYTTNQIAEEILIYADKIDYDSKNNIIATGKVKIISDNQILTSNLVIIDKNTKELTLPIEFTYKDEDNNYYYGSSGKFTSNFENGEIHDLKILMNDGSRIAGKHAFKTGKIDLIDKGVFSPCESKIDIKNFVCPIWQIEGEKILHDRDKLFLHHKHAKMRIVNFPVYYLPYLVSPSPLRTERKSGFLNPKVNFFFIDSQNSQSASFPYYFAISEDKELLLTPTINYGGGVDASQYVSAIYDQLVSGGTMNLNFSSETNFEQENNENWVRDASLITNVEANYNEKFKYTFNSAFQTSPTYLRRTDQNNLLNRNNTLATELNIAGYNLRKFDDNFNFIISGYQVVKNDEDNKTTPTTLPYISYSLGSNFIGLTTYQQNITFYNIFRDNATTDHAQKQQKAHHKINSEREFYRFNSKINFKTELHSQYYNIKNKKIDSQDYSGTYGRIFPMSGIYFETPVQNEKNNINIVPKASFILNGSQPSSHKVSNEESTNNNYTLLNSSSLNRYTGTDKLDNSKRVNYGIDLFKDLFTFSLSQSYEFDANSQYNKEVGLKDYMSDLLGNSSYEGEKNQFSHGFRLNVDKGIIESQTATYQNENKIGISTINYNQERAESNLILKENKEMIDYTFTSNKIYHYSTINFTSKYDIHNDDILNYNIGYQYFDECFGFQIDFDRSFYEDRDLKPKDTLTALFAFKHLGSYKSSNLAVSEADKQEIRWLSESINDEVFD